MTKNIGFIVLGGVIVIAAIGVILQRQKKGSDERQGTEKLSAEQVVGLEVQADAQNNR